VAGNSRIVHLFREGMRCKSSVWKSLLIKSFVSYEPEQLCSAGDCPARAAALQILKGCIPMDSLRPHTLSDYLRLAGRHKLTIAVPTARFVIASGIAIWQLPNVYESTTFVIVESPQGGAASDRPSIDIGRRLTTIRQQVTTRSGLEELIGKYGLYKKMRE